MYRIEVNILGWKELSNYSLEGVTLDRFYDSDSIRVRAKMSGDISFTGDSFELLYAEKQSNVLRIQFRMFLYEDVIYTGQLQLQGDWFLNERKCLLEVEIDDDYTKILQNLDNEIRIQPLEINTHSLVKVTQLEQMQSATSQYTGIYPDSECAFSGEAFNSLLVPDYDEDSIYIKGRNLGIDNDQRNYYSGYVNFSYCKVDDGLIKFFIATKSGNLVHPFDADQTDWIQVTGTSDLPGFPKMLQLTSKMKFNSAVLSEYVPLWVFGTTNAPTDQESDLITVELKQALTDAISLIDSSISMGSWDLGNVYLYSNNNEMFTYSLEDLINIYKTLFNVDWLLDNKVFEMKTVDQSKPQQPASYDENQYQYIDRVFASDWSEQKFNFDIKNKVNRFSLEVDTDWNDLDFARTYISYDVYYQSSNDVQNSTFVLDVAAMSTRGGEEVAVLLQDNSGYLINDFGLEGEFTYNYGLSLYNLVDTYHTKQRPFESGVLSSELNSYSKDVILEKDFNEVATINVPYNNPNIIDFGLYLKSSFGDLKIIEINTNLKDQSSTITASKQ